MKYTDLPGWSKLTKTEKKRVKEVHAERFKQNYNVDGSKSISKKEFEKGVTRKHE